MTRQSFTQLYEGADHEDTHFDGLLAVEHVRGHDRAVLGEGVWWISRIPMLLGTGHKL